MIWPEKKNKNKSTVKWERSRLGSMHLVTGVLRSVKIRSASLNHLAEVIFDEPNDSLRICQKTPFTASRLCVHRNVGDVY